ncbi:MAG TPA: hypothetical protein VF205_08685, partial [Nitrospiraceae bacterium]
SGGGFSPDDQIDQRLARYPSHRKDLAACLASSSLDPDQLLLVPVRISPDTSPLPAVPIPS